MTTPYADVIKTARPDSTTPWYETPNSTALSNLNLHTPQATGRDKAMNTDSQDAIWKVIQKLSTLDDLFTFYWFAIDKVDLRKESIEGVFSILGDCIAELKEAVK